MKIILGILGLAGIALAIATKPAPPPLVIDVPIHANPLDDFNLNQEGNNG